MQTFFVKRYTVTKDKMTQFKSKSEGSGIPLQNDSFRSTTIVGFNYHRCVSSKRTKKKTVFEVV